MAISYDQDMLFDDKEEAESDDEASETPAQRKKKSDEALKKRKMKEDQKTKNKKAKKDTEESEDEEDKEIEQAESEYLNRPDAGEGEKKDAEESRCVLTRFFDQELVLNWLYRFLDSQKNTRSQFSVPGLRKIHRNLKQNKFNSREGFFRKSPFCTFFCINFEFGRPWDVL